MKYKRMPLRIIGDKSFLVNTSVIIVGLVLVSGCMVFIANFGVMIQSSSTLETATPEGPIFQKLLVNFGWTLGLMILMSLAAVYLFANKIAGPMYRLNNTLERMLSGDFGRTILFRKGDAFATIGERVEALRSKFVSKMDAAKNGIDGIEKEINEIIESAQANETAASSRALCDRLVKLGQTIKIIKAELNA